MINTGRRFHRACGLLLAVALGLAACANQTADRAASTGESAAKEESQSAGLQSESRGYYCKNLFDGPLGINLVHKVPVCAVGVGVVLAPIVAGAIILSPFWLINSASKQLKSAFKKLPASDTEEKGTPGEWRADYHLSRVRSWLASAKCGDANSQDKVGHSYQTGYGVSKDALEAYVWYRLAIINARWVDYLHSANRFLDKVKAQLIPEQVAEAERRIKAWKPEPAACEVQQQADGKTN